MREIKWIGVVALSIIFYIGWEQGSKKTRVAVGSENAQAISSLESELKKLRDEYEQLKIKNASSNIEETERIYSQSSSVQVIDNKNKNLLTQEEVLASVEKIKELYKADPKFDISIEKTKIYESEPIDIAWAAIREKAISDAFASESSLQGKSIKSIECRSKHCRIEIFFQDVKDVGSMANDFYEITRKEPYKKLFVSGGDMGLLLQEKVLSVYLASDPKTMFFK